MKEIARFYDAEEAQIAAGYLRSQGFEIQLADEGALGVQPHLSIGLGGYRLMALPQEAHMASVELAKVRDVPARSRTVVNATCEQCHSQKLRRIRNPWFPLLVSVLFQRVFPFAPATQDLRCTACGHRQPAEPRREEQ
ncbi:MAG: hypothetical protein AAGA69_01820 [Pseudomonadota bacterium]